MKYSLSDKKQYLALIGCGYWGTIIARTLIKLNFKKIIIYDFNKKNSHTLKSKFKDLIIANSIDVIHKNQEIKNVFIAIPPTQSFLIVKDLLTNNKNIFLEKPGFTNIQDLEKINKISVKKKLKLMFGYIYYYNNYIEKIAKILKHNRLGKIRYINFQRQNLGPIRNDVDVDYDLTSHDLSIIDKFYGKMPKILSYKKYDLLKKKNADISNLHLKLNDIYIDINNSWINATKIRKISIIGDKKMLLFDEMNIDHPIKIFNQYAKYPKIQRFNKKFFEQKALIYNGINFSIPVKHNAPLENEIKAFFKNNKNKTDYKLAKKILLFLKRI